MRDTSKSPSSKPQTVSKQMTWKPWISGESKWTCFEWHDISLSRSIVSDSLDSMCIRVQKHCQVMWAMFHPYLLGADDLRQLAMSFSREEAGECLLRARDGHIPVIVYKQTIKTCANHLTENGSLWMGAMDCWTRERYDKGVNIFLYAASSKERSILVTSVMIVPTMELVALVCSRE